MAGRTRYVYVISSPFGFQKIGWTIDLPKRLQTLNQAHPMPLTLHFSVECEQATQVETLTHYKLKTQRTQGEWFDTTPDYAKAVVLAAISELASRVPWERASRKTQTTLRKPSARWTPERIALLSAMWLNGVTSRAILDKINDMTGTRVEMSAVSAKAKELSLSRPPGFYNSHNSAKWTPVRDELLREMWIAGVLPDDLLSALNELPGDALHWRDITYRANARNIRRSDNYESTISAYMRRKMRNSRWTDDREKLLELRYPTYATPSDILAEMAALPGAQDLTWERVRERAKHKNLKRPVDFSKWHRGEILRHEREIAANTTVPLKGKNK